MDLHCFLRSMYPGSPRKCLNSGDRFSHDEIRTALAICDNLLYEPHFEKAFHHALRQCYVKLGSH